MFEVRIGEDERHEFDFANPGNQELMLLEKLYGGPFGDWLDDLGKRSATATTALVCMLRRREHPLLRMTDVVFSLKDVRFIDLDTEDAEGKAKTKGKAAKPTPSSTESAND